MHVMREGKDSDIQSGSPSGTSSCLGLEIPERLRAAEVSSCLVFFLRCVTPSLVSTTGKALAPLLAAEC